MTMTFKKYQKLKAMRSFRQKFSEMTREYRNGFWKESSVEFYAVGCLKKAKLSS